MPTKTTQPATMTTTRTTKEPTVKNTETTLTASTIDQIINRARTLAPKARVELLKGYTPAALFQMHEQLLGAAKPKTPRVVLEKKILAALAAPVQVAEQPASEEPIVATAEAAVIDEAEAEIAATAGSDAEIADAAEDSTHTEGVFVGVTGEEPQDHTIEVPNDTAPEANESPDNAPTDEAASTDAPATDDATTGADATSAAPAPKRRGRPAKATVARADENRACTPEEMAAEAEAAKPDADANTTAKAELPPIGTILIKVDRHGAERCRATIVADGVLYAGKVHKSLSAAAIAASRDLGNTTKQTSGPKFWGLVQSAPGATTNKGLDLDVLSRAWDRYLERAVGASKCAGDEDVAKLREMLLAHSTALTALATPTAVVA